MKETENIMGPTLFDIKRPNVPQSRITFSTLHACARKSVKDAGRSVGDCPNEYTTKDLVQTLCRQELESLTAGIENSSHNSSAQRRIVKVNAISDLFSLAVRSICFSYLSLAFSR